MAQAGTSACFKHLLICAMISSMQTITLSNQNRTKYRTTSTIEPSLVITASSTTSKYDDVLSYRYINSHNRTTCILLKTDAVVEVKFLVDNLEEQVDSFVPEALIDGDCQKDSSFMRLSWKDFYLLLNFAKTPAGKRWYIKNIELTVNPDALGFDNIMAYGKSIKLYHKDILFPTPVGKSYSCQNVEINLQPDKDDLPPPGLKGFLFLRKLQLQPFMYKGEEFESSLDCEFQNSYRNKTTSIAVGITLIMVIVMTVIEYGIF